MPELLWLVVGWKKPKTTNDLVKAVLEREGKDPYPGNATKPSEFQKRMLQEKANVPATWEARERKIKVGAGHMVDAGGGGDWGSGHAHREGLTCQVILRKVVQQEKGSFESKVVLPP